jgi:hypothetical protein
MASPVVVESWADALMIGTAIGVAVLLAVGVASMRHPLYGLASVIVVVQFESLVPVAFGSGLTLGRLVGLVAVFGWLFRRDGIRIPRLLGSSGAAIGVPLLLSIPLLLVGAAFAYDSAVAGGQVVRVVMLIAMAFMTADLVRNRRDMRVLAVAAALSGAVGAAVGGWQYVVLTGGGEYVGYVFQTSTGGVRVAGLTANPNALGIGIVTGFPFAVWLFMREPNRLLRLGSLVVILLSLGTLVLTVSRSNLAVALAALIVFALGTRVGWGHVVKRGALVLGAAAIVWTVAGAAGPYVSDSTSTAGGHRGVFGCAWCGLVAPERLRTSEMA